MKGISKTWIDTKLSRNERERLVGYLLDVSSNPTGEQILEAIKIIFPKKKAPSVQSCLNWKNAQWNFELYLRELDSRNRAAKLISENSGDIADANKKMVDDYVYEQLTHLRNGQEVDVKGLKSWITAASNLASRSVADKRLEADLKKAAAQIKILEKQISEYKAKEDERKEALSSAISKTDKKEITEEFLEEIQKIMGLK